VKTPNLVRRATRRFGWGVADQAFSSLTNFLLGVAVARSVSPSEFGAFNLAFTGYLIALGISRALTTEPLAVRYSTTSEDEWRSGVAAASGTAAVVGIISGIGCLLFTLFAEGPTADAFLALGFVMPGLLMQDCWRLSFFPAARGRSAFVNDLVWALALFPSLAVVLIGGDNILLWGTFVWGCSASVAAMVGAFQSHTRPRITSALLWWRAHRDLASRFVTQSVVYSSAGQFVYWGIAVVASLAAVGALRAGFILLGPLNMAFTGMGLVAVPEGARMLARGTAQLRNLCRQLSWVLGLMALGWGFVAFFLPSSVGTWLLGESWERGHDVVIPLTLMMISIGLASGPLTGLRALGAANEILRVGVVVAVLNLLGALGGAYLGGPVGAAWGMGVANAAGALAARWEFEGSASRRDSDEKQKLSE
jgi:O-antigen/teichoic acid export membrane protein